MTKITETLLNNLNEVFAPMDAEVLVASQAWAKGRVTALREYKMSDEYKEQRLDQHKLYARLFAIAGGKTWYNAFDGRSLSMIEELMVKNCESIVKKRNAAIVAKLEKAGVTEVVSETYNRTKDGFDGVFVINTDAGRKVVTINTIRAGGYNIQCLHLRVLVKVK